MAQTTVRLHPLAADSAKRLMAELEAEYGRDASREEIVAAVVYGASAAQLVGMLIAFTKAAAAQDGR